MNLYIYKYNNYYNRIVKQENTLTEYGEPVHRLLNCKDFTPGDAVNTIHTFGSAANNYDGSGDYLIVADESGNILSRWFIIETDFTRQGQWKITLRRDLVVDYYDAIVNAPTFIEKATLNADDPLVFNSENMTVNQIKTDEKLLKDNSGCPWLVGYYAKGATIQGTVNTNDIEGISYKQIDSPIEQWDFYQYSNLATTGKSFYAPPTSGSYIINARKGSNSGAGYIFKSNIFNGVTTYDTKARDSENFGLYFKSEDPQQQCNSIKTKITPKLTILKSLLQSFIPFNNQEFFDELLSYSGSLIKDGNGRYYNVTVTQLKPVTRSVRGSGSLQVEMEQIAISSGFTRFSEGSTSNYEATITCNAYSVALVERTDYEISYNITENANRIITTDAPWNIFAIPFGELQVKLEDNTEFTTKANIAISTAASMLLQESDDLYDIQLLPYCPVNNLLVGDEGTIELQNKNQYSLINIPSTEDPVPASIVLHVEKAKFSFDISKIKIASGSTNIDKKINNECDKWRLASPNFSSYFDFSVEKNDGIQYFNVDCEYKPFTPYIHVNPNFNGLYGYDDNSPRGLVLSGDFSLSRVKNAWQTYLLQNKNFQNIFDRQIQNMEVQQKYQRIGDIVGAITGTASGAATGALAGSMVMPGIGTGIGAAVGGIASAAGGIADYAINEQLRTEALDYTRDMFGYQLGNIQALPNTISKISAFNDNNKIFPILEYYTCTDREKEALINKIAWNGMTVGAIGTIADYIGNSWVYNNIESKGYIKGRIIRVENLEDEFHLLKEISNEIYKGVYF